MGNRMCKKKMDTVDNPKTPSPFDRIFSRLHLKSKSWKSDSQLDRKKVNRYEVNPKDAKNGKLSTTQPLSKSSDWTEVELEVPEKENAIHLKNPQLSFIFSDNTTPTPPPRKHKKTLREKIETVAKNSINALQSKKSDPVQNEERDLAEEPICIKRIVIHGCPACDGREKCSHKETKTDVSKVSEKPDEIEKRRKSLSVVSLPNYTDLKLSLTDPGEDLKYIDASVTNSANSLPNGEHKRLSTTSASTGRFENYMTRCRSFGSLLNNKLKIPKKASGNESDDSFGGLEDWDLGILEHYNPKDASLPRPRKSLPDSVAISDIENLIIPDDEIVPPPVRPLRRSESLVKKLSEDVVESAQNKTEVQPEQGSEEHSSLMRILREFTVKDVQHTNDSQSKTDWCNVPSANINEDFINAEKVAVS